MADLFKCSIESCGFSAPAERMWNLDRKITKGDLVILCGRDAHAARERGLKAFRLAETLRRDAERKAEKERQLQEREEFFAKFGRPRLADAFERARSNGHSSRQIVQVE